MATKKVDLRAQLLLAALACADGDTTRTFSSEDLLLAAWGHDQASWGLRGYEKLHPDSNRIHRELDSRGKGQQGIVGAGFLEKTRPRTYRLTPKGLAAATAASKESPEALERVGRVMEGEVTRVLEHPVFVRWLGEPDTPTRFRDAGHFWGVAPGTPPRVIRQRLRGVEDTLEAARELLDNRALARVADNQGRVLYERGDVDRALAFHGMLKERFQNDLKALAGPEPL